MLRGHGAVLQGAVRIRCAEIRKNPPGNPEHANYGTCGAPSRIVMMKSWHIPVGERPNGSYGLLLPGNVPRFFKFLPLVNSTNVGVPAVFHSSSFSTVENRDISNMSVHSLSHPLGDMGKRSGIADRIVDWLGKQLPGLRHL
jgi:hypothetical protein